MLQPSQDTSSNRLATNKQNGAILKITQNEAAINPPFNRFQTTAKSTLLWYILCTNHKFCTQKSINVPNSAVHLLPSGVIFFS